jgi:hypothetical protein
VGNGVSDAEAHPDPLGKLLIEAQALLDWLDVGDPDRVSCDAVGEDVEGGDALPSPLDEEEGVDVVDTLAVAVAAAVEVASE